MFNRQNSVVRNVDAESEMLVKGRSFMVSIFPLVPGHTSVCAISFDIFGNLDLCHLNLEVEVVRERWNDEARKLST